MENIGLKDIVFDDYTVAQFLSEENLFNQSNVLAIYTEEDLENDYDALTKYAKEVSESVFELLKSAKDSIYNKWNLSMQDVIEVSRLNFLKKKYTEEVLQTVWRWPLPDTRGDGKIDIRREL